MTEQRNDRQRHAYHHQAAWQAARQWKERAQQARPSSQTSGFKLVLTWLLFGFMMIVGTLFGLFFLLLGWLMLPLVRHRMKKHMERMRADQAEDIGSGDGSQHTHQGTHHNQQVLEGDYQVKE